VFEDDQIGTLAPRLGQLGEEAARHPGQLVLSLFETNGLAFDGVAFFADTRVIGRSANIDNIQTQTGTTVANIQTDLAVVRQRLRLFQDDQGRPMNNILNTIVCNPDIESAMYQALNVPFPAAAPGVQQIPPAGDISTVNGYTIIVNPYITTAGDWYGMAVTPTMKPFIYQTRIAPSLEDLTLGSEDAVKRDRFVYGVRARYEVGYGDPRYAVRVR
jgi:phage major head subunit gpT-like protein